MQNHTSKKLYVIMYHLPFQVVASRSPMVVINGFVTVYCDKVLMRIGGQFTVKVGSCNNRFLVLCKSACGVFDDGKSNGHYFVQCFLVLIECDFVKFINLIKNLLALIDRCFFNSFAKFGNLIKFFLSCILYEFLNFFGFRTKFIVGKSLNFWICSFQLLNERLNLFHITGRFVTK